MALKSIREEWEFFSKLTLQEGAGETQRREMEWAFFAGAMSIVMQFREIGEPHISEQVAFHHMNNLLRECDEFKERVMRKLTEGN